MIDSKEPDNMLPIYLFQFMLMDLDLNQLKEHLFLYGQRKPQVQWQEIYLKNKENGYRLT